MNCRKKWWVSVVDKAGSRQRVFRVSHFCCYPPSDALIHFRKYVPQRGGYKKSHRNPLSGSIRVSKLTITRIIGQIKCPTLIHVWSRFSILIWFSKYQEPTVLWIWRFSIARIQPLFLIPDFFKYPEPEGIKSPKITLPPHCFCYSPHKLSFPLTSKPCSLP